jgi:hypothetical protein
MRHTSARAVRQHIAGASPGWHLQQTRDALRIVDPDDDGLQEVGLHIDSLTDLAVRTMMAPPSLLILLEKAAHFFGTVC